MARSLEGLRVKFCTHLSPHACYMSCPTYLPSYNDSDIVIWKVEIMKLPIITRFCYPVTSCCHAQIFSSAFCSQKTSDSAVGVRFLRKSNFLSYIETGIYQMIYLWTRDAIRSKEVVKPFWMSLRYSWTHFRNGMQHIKIWDTSEYIASIP
jgi:hypothetical protein